MATTIDSLQLEIISNSSKAYAEIDKLAKSLKNLKNATGNLEKASKNLQNFSSTAKKSTSIISKLGLGHVALAMGVRKVYQYLGQSVNSINDYVENMNLFNVSMGEFSKEAEEYANLVQEKMGIDASQWMRNQGIFMSMANGFHLAKEQAYEMSKGMTELSYDMSSFYNIPIQEALTKMRSAMAGEIEPLRALGISLTEATLQEVALANGITKKVNAMTEGEKAQLRYIAIVQSATNQGVIGDFAKTLESPANAMRILQQQITLMGRAIGSVLLPIITQVIPYIQAFVKVLTSAISRLATLVGFKMPKWDNKSWSEGATSVGDTADALGNATKKAKEYKKSLQGFDELNIIPAPQEPSGGSGASTGVGGDLGLDIKSVWDKAAIEGITTEVDQIIEKFKGLGTTIKETFSSETVLEFIKVVGSIGVGILAWTGISKLGGFVGIFDKIGTAFLDLWIWFDKIKVGLSALGTVFSTSFLPILAVIIGVASVVYVLWDNFNLVVDVVKGFVEKIRLAEKFEGIKEALKPLMEHIAGLRDLFTFVGTVLITLLQPAIAVIMGVFNALVMVIKPVITIVDGVIQIFSGLGSFLLGVFTLDMNKTKEGLATIWNGIKDIFWGAFTFITGAFLGFIEGFIAWLVSFGANVGQIFTNIWNKAGQIVSGAWNGMINGAKSAWEGIKKVFGSVASWFGKVFGDAWAGIVKIFNAGGEIFKNIKDGIATAFKSVVNGLIRGINNVVSTPFNAINNALRTIRDISIMGIKPFSGLIRTVSVPSIPLLASGGIVNSGQMFIARENGIPEMVGTIGGQSAVANNQQIVEGISAGVYEAVVKAMSGDGKNITINATFELDGSAIGKSVVKYHNGVVTQTGSSPLLI